MSPELVTSRNNSHADDRTVHAVFGQTYSAPDGPSFRIPRPYVEACGTGSLALLYESGRVSFGAMSCGSWSCDSCRPRLAARLLDRLRGGMEARDAIAPRARHLITLTIDPAQFGAVPIGRAYWNADGSPARTVEQVKLARTSVLWSEPSKAQFAAAASAMSKAWDDLNKRLRGRAKRAGLPSPEYFRVIELHRNGWPHYHVVFEGLVGDVEWPLGRVDVRPVDLDGAVGEVAPYLICSEKKSGGSKGYQFAARALPKNFRLWSASRRFLSLLEVEEHADPIIHGLPVRGHFMGHADAVRAFGGDALLALNPPTDGDHRPPSRVYCTGESARQYYAELYTARTLHIPVSELRVIGSLSEYEPASIVVEPEEVRVESNRFVEALYWDTRLGGYVPGALWFGACDQIPVKGSGGRADLS